MHHEGSRVLRTRDDELTRLQALYDEVRTSSAPRLAILVGPPGCGARQLIDRFLTTVQPPATLRGVGVRNRAFGTFQSLLPARWKGLGESSAQEVVVDLGAYAERRVRFFSEVRSLLAQLAGPAPAVVVVEDLDRADRGTLELLEYLLEARWPGAEPASPPVLFVATAESLDRTDVAKLRAAPASVVVPLGPLDEEGVRAYLARDEVVARVIERTGGMPEHIDELFASPPRPTRTTADELSAGARSLFDAATILDRPATIEELVAVAGTTPRLADTEELVEGGWMLPTIRAGVLTLRARSRTLRDAHYDAMDPARRRTLHRAAAQICADEAPDEAARHAILAGDVPLALRLAIAASESLAAAHGPHEAVEVLREIVDATGREAPLEISAKLAELLLASGDFAGAMPHARRVRDAQPDDAHAALLHARVLAGSGDMPTARDEVRRALAHVEDEHLAVELSIELAQIEYARGHLTDAKRIAADAMAKAAEHGWLPLELDAAYVTAKAALGLCELDEAERIATQAHERAERAGLGRQACHLINTLGNVAWRRDDLERARTMFERAAELAEDIGAALHHAVALENVAVIDQTRERYARAALGYRRAHEALARTGHAEKLARLLYNLAALRCDIGDAASALELCQRARAQVSDVSVVYTGKEVEGWAHLQLGSFDAATAAFAAALEGAERFGDVRLARDSRIGLAMAAYEAGRLEQAAEHLAALGSDLGKRGEARRAWLRAALADASEGLRLAGQAVEAARAAGSAVLELRARLLLATRLLEVGAHDRAAEEHRRLIELEEALSADVPPEDRAVFRDRPDALAIVGLSARLGQRTSRVVERQSRGEHPALAAIAGQSAPIAELRAWIERVGPSDRLVLIRGESGVGKELVADALHATSSRRNKPLVKVNCAAIVETLLLSELFGHERGAFTGAHTSRKGRFEIADGGTLFLDEIGEISPRTQAALLRVLQEQTFERVGGTRTITVDVRVVAATNRDLKALVREGRFREDLYYRLSGMTVYVPPLRERLEDLPVLCARILSDIARESGRTVRLSSDAIALLRRHKWPGNVRELQNVLRSAVLMSESAILTPSDLRPFLDTFETGGERSKRDLAVPVDGATLPDLFYGALRDGGRSIYDLRRDVERRCIERALEEAGGNITTAADLLGMKRSRVSQLVKEHGLKKGEKAS